jgi:hypothetical protein
MPVRPSCCHAAGATVEPLESRVLAASVSGPLRQWQAVELDFRGPVARETNTAPNPFLDFRLQVTFTHATTGKRYEVPGFFDGNGAGGAAGSVWTARLTPDRPGRWTYSASFRTGVRIAVSASRSAGTPTAFNGDSGSFVVAPRDPTAPGFLKWGRLEYDAGGTRLSRHYLKFRDGPYFIKGGLNSPENFLGYAGFEDTTAGPFGLHRYAAHVPDWKPGDPDWGGGRGKGIVGAVNYLAAHGVNSVYFLPMNVGGDAQDTWPFAGPVNRAGSAANDNLHYDVGKLRQWETVFAHAERKGLLLHVVLNETEAANKRELDGGVLGAERKLFYREMAARFAHHNAVQWNISEEYDRDLKLTPGAVKAFASYLRAVDPYDHPVTVHNWGGNPDSAWTPFLGDARFSLTSFQHARKNAGRGAEVETWRLKTEAAGRPLPISLDEFQPTTPSNLALQRKEMLWPTYLSGGHLEYYFGAGVDVTADNFRPYEQLWNWTGYARSFFQQHLPFWRMAPADALLTGESGDFGGGQVFAEAGRLYAVYLPNATRTGRLELGNARGPLLLRWFNPRTGAFEGAARRVAGGAPLPLGLPPGSNAEDWVVLLERAPAAA